MLQRSLSIAALTTIIGLGVVAPTLSVLAAPQQQPDRVSQLRYENYQINSVYKGKPAALVVNTQEEQNYASQLREGIKKGTNFAGHYAIAYLDRAMGGVGSAGIVDLKTGKIYLPPQLHGYHDQRGAGYTPPRPDGGLHYKANSKLLIIIGQAGGNDGQKGIGKFYYKWENNQLKFLTFVNSPYQSQ